MSNTTATLSLKFWNDGKNLFAMSFFVIFVIFSVTVVFFETQLSSSVMQSVEDEQTITTDRINYQVHEKLTKYRNDLLFLYATPPIAGLANTIEGKDKYDDSTFEQWKLRLETIFVAFIQHNSEYEQLRIISANGKGKELVRVDRDGGGVKVVSNAQLQNKSNNDYYKQSTQLLDGQMYLSPISLNREFGEIEFPYRPMLRLSIPIFDNQMRRFGFLIMNINATQLLDSLQNIVEEPSQLALTDSEGYFLLHPSEQLMFSKDLNPDETWDSHYSVGSKTDTQLYKVTENQNSEERLYSLGKKIILSSNLKDGFLIAHILTPDEVLKNVAMQRRTNVYAFLFVITSVLLFILIAFDRGLRKSQELAETRAESDAIVDASKDAIIGLNSKGQISSWNRAARNLFRLNIEQVINQSIADLSLFPNVDFALLINNLANGVSQQSIDTTIDSGNGQVLYVSLSLSAIVKDGSRFSGVAVIVRDVTNERIADEKIRKANAELEIKVAQRTAELEKVSDVKSAFISNISHEMRTPLNGIIGTLNLIRKEPLSEEQCRYLDMAEVSVNSLAVLINDILDLSKIEAGKLDLDYKAFNPAKLIETLSTSMAVKAQEKGIEFIVDTVDIQCESIISDPHRYSQILTNIVNNAIKFTKHGSILVKAYSKQKDDSHCGFYCEVTDTGIGIAEEYHGQLFTAFSQENSSVAPKFGGTGLGLSICKQLCSLLNGEITFESIKDKGSTFSFWINIPNVNATPKKTVKYLAGNTVSILVENSQLEKSLQNIVTKLGAIVVSESELLEYLDIPEQLPKSLPNILIFDQHDQRLHELDKRWLALQKSGKAPEQIVALHNTAEAKVLFSNIKPIFISKPLSTSEFLAKCGKKGQASEPAESIHSQRQTTDISAMDMKSLDGATVLVVDDNEINIEVAIGILKPTAVNTLRAANGQQAIEQLLKSDADGETVHCVLMDCQMPILNGYDATKKIRNGAAGDVYIDVPIIAMTANAMQGEKQKCLDAGMSDYVTKPISAEKLTAKLTSWVLSKYIPQNKLKDVSHSEQEISLDGGESALPVWDKDAALQRLMNNQTLLNKIVHLFIETSLEKL
ncbi:ATP-binding protein [Aliiglaciecola lipolytica]|uniref:histidine kinase n=1 Tax=Aliiglaciecola lipolytica E3 TaxID=1127673 RepID=K6YEU6_9ALTE|nr:ATP-binding protein [Aliiglaciecola lipolytica]GAC16692.1 multi-sensor hybrid histidine kinase [Aliiglaciecola lipolytica E3]